MGEHTWATRMGIEHCTTCGTCRRADGRNEPCRGKLPPIKPRASRRRLIGWRVRWEQWVNGWTGWEPREVTWTVEAGLSDTTARMFARCAQTALTDSNGTRRIRVVRVYRRTR